MKPTFLFGFDIGSISINTVVMDKDGRIVEERYDYNHGKPFEKLKEILDKLGESYSQEQFEHISFTGTGGKLAAELLHGSYVNEIVAQSTSVAKLYPAGKDHRGDGWRRFQAYLHGGGRKQCFPFIRF